jgi:hypothetical protein
LPAQWQRAQHFSALRDSAHQWTSDVVAVNKAYRTLSPFNLRVSSYAALLNSHVRIVRDDRSQVTVPCTASVPTASPRACAALRIYGTSPSLALELTIRHVIGRLLDLSHISWQTCVAHQPSDHRLGTGSTPTWLDTEGQGPRRRSCSMLTALQHCHGCPKWNYAVSGVCAAVRVAMVASCG